jgi:hypothetical protein
MMKLPEFSLMDFEPYRLAHGKLLGIQGQLDEAGTALQKLSEARPESSQIQRGKQIQAVLAGQDPEDIQEIEKWQENVVRATKRRNLLEEAFKVQETKVAEERVKASKEICAKVKSDYLKDNKRLYYR